MDNMFTHVDRNEIDANNAYKLTTGLTVLQRLLVRQVQSGIVTRDQTVVIDAALAAGRAGAQLVRVQLDRLRRDPDDALRTIAETLVVATAELERQLNLLDGTISRLRS